MAVFPDNTVFTVRKGVIPAGKNTLQFFEDEQFFKGSFSLWSKDIQFGIRYMPEKRFNSNIYANLNTAFANQNVVVTLKTFFKNDHVISGKLLKIENPENPYEIPSVIAIEDNVSKKITYIKVHDIESITADKSDFMNDIYSAPCWMFTRKNSAGAMPFEFSYLSSGIAWQSTIELHLKSKDKMDIIHNAAIRNNRKKFDCPEFYLVSGSPEIATANITSLLCQNAVPVKSYAARPAQLKRKSLMNAAADYAPLPESAMFIQQNSDVLYRKIGRISLDENESRLVKLQSAADVPYRTLVKWVIEPLRNYYGKAVNADKNQIAQNTLIFKNLCPAMLDKSPIAIYADNKLMMLTGLDSNTPVGSERAIRLSDADGIECKIEENELVKSRQQNIFFNNRRYVKCTVEATLKITNHRKIAAPCAIEYNFNGEFVKCSEKNNLIQKADGASLLNPAGQLDFEFELAPAETRIIKAVYTVLTAL